MKKKTAIFIAYIQNCVVPPKKILAMAMRLKSVKIDHDWCFVIAMFKKCNCNYKFSMCILPVCSC